MTFPSFATRVIAATVALSLPIGIGGVARANSAPPPSSSETDENAEVTHGEVYDTLKNAGFESTDARIDGLDVTIFYLEEGLSLTVPKPTSGAAPGVQPALSGKMNRNGEPVIYLNQRDQAAVQTAGKAALAGLLATLGPMGKVGKFLAGALGVSVAEFIGSNGICSGKKKTLRITGTSGGDAIKEIKCV